MFYSHTLYIGHHINTGLYALPAIADTSEVNPLVDRGLIVLLDKTSFSVLPYYSGNNYNVEPQNVENHTILLGNANKKLFYLTKCFYNINHLFFRSLPAESRTKYWYTKNNR